MTPNRAAVAAVISAVWAPIHGWVARPLRWSSSTILPAVAAGTAKPMPTLPPPATPFALGTVEIAVFTPTWRPAQVTSGPPELPGLMAASVWIAPARTVVPPPALGTGMWRFNALTIPLVTVPDSPSGAPRATTGCPTTRTSRRARVSTGRPVRSTFNRARSVIGSVPIRVAGSRSPSLNSTSIVPELTASAITWSLVSTRPSAEMIEPLPEPALSLPVANTVTTEGRTDAESATVSQVPAAGRVASTARAPPAPASRASTSPPTPPSTSLRRWTDSCGAAAPDRSLMGPHSASPVALPPSPLRDWRADRPTPVPPAVRPGCRDWSGRPRSRQRWRAGRSGSPRPGRLRPVRVRTPPAGRR